MSIFGVMNGAISGLTSQSDTFGNISENVANSQTVGVERIDLAAARADLRGGLVVGSVEGSNVDVATGFSQMIIAWQACSANARAATTANAILSATINMKR